MNGDVMDENVWLMHSIVYAKELIIDGELHFLVLRSPLVFAEYIGIGTLILMQGEQDSDVCMHISLGSGYPYALITL